MPQNSLNFERWMWIELIGFDVRISDFGIEALFKRNGFTPHAVTLLLSDAEFVHGHTGQSNRVFPPSVCSYEGHPSNEDRQRQVWTADNLSGLVNTLKAKGVQVFFTHFDFWKSGWLKQHPELRIMNRQGQSIEFISPYKNLSDGRPYRDVYVPQVLRVISDFGFDGYHAGDGFAHPRVPIYEGDFSDDSIAQFEAWSEQLLPLSIRAPANSRPTKIQARARWIWQKKRLDWINFHRWRTLEFWRLFAAELHKAGKHLVFNSCWTRDPFEALYRYGVDYAALREIGVDTFLAETASAGHEYGGDLPFGEDGIDDWSPHHILTKFSTKLSLLRAAVPDVKIIFMNGIKDTNEAWNGIRHAPTNVESEIFSHSALFHVDEKGKYKRAADGVISVLSDGLAEHEWKWVTDRWNLGFSLQPRELIGAAVYWTQFYKEALLQDYVDHRRVPFDRIIWKLRASGAPILATVRQENLKFWDGPLVVIHPHLLSQEEWFEILKHKSIIFALGPFVPKTPRSVKRLSIRTGASELQCAIFGWEGPPLKRVKLPVALDLDKKKGDPFEWLADLPAQTVPTATFEHIADWINASVSGIRVEKYRSDLRAWGYSVGKMTLRIYVRNESFYYRTATVNVGRSCGQIRTLTAFPAGPVNASGSGFRFKMAGKSTAIFDVHLK